MADVVTVNVATGEKTERAFTAAERTDRDSVAAAAAAAKTTTDQRATRRTQAVQLLDGMAAKAPSTWTATEQRKAMFILARVVELVDLDPGA